MSEHDMLSNHNVHGWLMEVPGYRENYRNERRPLMDLNDIKETDETSIHEHKERPSSLLSISSEDSINLEELINANFTTDMDDETDLPALSSLDLDDSNEDFWKMDNFLNNLIIPTHQYSPLSSRKIRQQLHNSSNRSKYEESDDDFLFDSKNTSLDDLLEEDMFFNPNNNSSKKVTEHDFIKGLSLSPNYDGFDKPKLLQVPTSLPVSPKSLTSSPIDRQQRMNRSGSMSSENSLNSLSTITQHRHHIYPSASTSTSSIGSHSTTTTATSSYLSRSSSKVHQHTTTNNNATVVENKSSRISQPRYRQPTSVSETTTTTTTNTATSENIRLLPSRSISHIGLARRATHIPAPASSPSKQKSSIIPSPSRTKSTTLVHKKSNSSLTRSASRIGQPATRASHIPTPPVRSTTSLGISSIFSSSPQKQQQRQQHSKDERPKTSMGSSIKSPPTTSGLRRAPSTMIPSSSRSTSLRMPNSRSVYNK